jgi:hypothetical protein
MEQVSFAALGAWVACALLAIELFFRFRAHQREEAAAMEPNPPLHKEYVSRAEHEALVALTKKEDAALQAYVDARFMALDKSRRENVDKLHGKIDHLELRTQQLLGEMRREVKDDVTGMHKRTDVILESLAELRGAVRTALKTTASPFGK